MKLSSVQNFMSNVLTSIKNMDYSATDPKSYLVVVPGISLVFLSIQNRLLNINPTFDQSKADSDPQYLKNFKNQQQACSRRFTWNLVGATIAYTAVRVALVSAGLSLFNPLFILSFASLSFAAASGLQNKVTVLHLNENGTLKKYTLYGSEFGALFS